MTRNHPPPQRLRKLLRANAVLIVLEQAEREDVVKRALASLAPPYRTVLVLREIEGLPYEEIAQVLGLAEGTVKSRLLRGRELLRRKLAAYVGIEHV